ncbi:Asp-tRNA(Asn)/Glu-tRNA(Gln) amidotransferase subunit GatA [Psychrobacillus sp. Sa2BUA9]|uniref:Glutamyl-tRNA(Gln) amidotransferase subunit A n=1 Tax=Psychrobacillus faecigallinarum TaxID=2762235 RepID=A0ABR8RDS3_9BACI|nr:Asp-tRNA(Asn)/Glu-tRNA(Gln) amidotransferase subunit GatA [Psychrobacillus faecigallinarum]MBD7945938.1 Asp-tRNA(Asn)/Glu-tRNA(Gln) amidotransferase subunit GatA [Psychrobacillus faecigallinarum]QGM28988.1 Asp-tRNA(Asn)/Glu-tRNA(Gln) amidotransferase subunit GatA [Bacillus sp. N3536]
MTLFKHSAAELQDLIKKKEVSIQELTAESYKRIDKVDGEVQAFLALNEEQATAQAKEMDQVPFEERGPLFGLPIGVKDNIVTEGIETTCASKILEGFNPIYDATVVHKLRDAGLITIGKLNMDEFAMGSSNENSAYKNTRNPWNLNHVPGGSSGGSAAAVAAGEVPFSLGSDTGGSIRQPASFCGVVGMKPTYGRVSRFGLVAFASSLDQIGPVTRNVADNAFLLEAISGLDANDSTSANVDVPSFTKSLTGDIKGLRIAVPKEYLGQGVGEASKQSVLDALKVLESLGATWEEVSLPHSKYALAAYYLLSSSEASSNLARFDGIRYGFRADNVENLMELYKETRAQGFGDEVKRRIMLGTYSLSAGSYDAYYRKAQQVRTLIKQDFDNVFEKYDVIIGPTTPTPAFKIGENVKDPLTMYANDILTIPVNLAGVPGISIPCGFAEGLPLGLQIIGKYFDEATIYRVAHAYEQATSFHKQTPQIWEGAK